MGKRTVPTLYIALAIVIIAHSSTAIVALIAFREPIPVLISVGAAHQRDH